MDILHRFKAFILSLINQIFLLLPRARPPPPPPATLVEVGVGDQNHREPAAPAAAAQYNLNWAMLMMGFCLPPAVEIAVQSVQIQSQLTPMFHFLSLAIILSFSLLFVSKFMSKNFPIVAQVLEQAGVLLAVTAIFVAVTIPSPLWLKCITWALYVISLIAIMVCKICDRYY